jgi:hypothetical protein
LACKRIGTIIQSSPNPRYALTNDQGRTMVLFGNFFRVRSGPVGEMNAGVFLACPQ